MENIGTQFSSTDLANHGIHNLNSVHWNLSTPRLIEQALRRNEGHLAANGALVVRTWQYTGRSPGDRFIVEDDITRDSVDWGDVNRPMSVGHFDGLHQKVRAYLQGQDAFVQDCYAGADSAYSLPIRAVTELAWHNLFARQLFVRADADATADHRPEFTIIYAPGLHADPSSDGTRSEAFVVLNFTKKLVLIGGTRYAGEMKEVRL